MGVGALLLLAEPDAEPSHDADAAPPVLVLDRFTVALTLREASSEVEPDEEEVGDGETGRDAEEVGDPPTREAVPRALVDPRPLIVPPKMPPALPVPLGLTVAVPSPPLLTLVPLALLDTTPKLLLVALIVGASVGGGEPVADKLMRLPPTLDAAGVGEGEPDTPKLLVPRPVPVASLLPLAVPLPL